MGDICVIVLDIILRKVAFSLDQLVTLTRDRVLALFGFVSICFHPSQFIWAVFGGYNYSNSVHLVSQNRFGQESGDATNRSRAERMRGMRNDA